MVHPDEEAGHRESHPYTATHEPRCMVVEAHQPTCRPGAIPVGGLRVSNTKNQASHWHQGLLLLPPPFEHLLDTLAESPGWVGAGVRLTPHRLADPLLMNCGSNQSAEAVVGNAQCPRVSHSPGRRASIRCPLAGCGGCMQV